MGSVILFTICSNNYWAQAMVLIKSAAKYNTSYKFYIGLVDDKHPSIDYTVGGIAETIPVKELNIDSTFKET